MWRGSTRRPRRAFVFNLAARQVAAAEGSSLSENARALALLNMASNDSLVASFWTKYHYKLWRPETAIFEGNLDGNAKTDADITYVPYILTPCFPSYPSNHGSGSNSAAEILRRVYGAGGHAITMANPAVPGVTFHYTRFNQITDDISDARIYGGIHFRFDQEAGADLGRDIGTYVYKHNLRRAKHSDHDDDGDNDDEHDGRSHRRDCHGVHGNGHPLDVGFVTLAERLHARGFHTGAFVSSFVLDRRWGLDRGFDVYRDSAIRPGRPLDRESLRRPADRVVDDAIDWLQQVGGSRFFAWLHFYDAHAPARPPAEFASPNGDDGYFGAIGFVDFQLSRVIAFLDERGLLDRTIVVAVGDHGESLDEHGEPGTRSVRLRSGHARAAHHSYAVREHAGPPRIRSGPHR